MQDWAATLSRRVWAKQVGSVKTEKADPIQRFSVGEDTDDYNEPVCWFVGLRGGIYSLKRYTKIKSH